MTGQKIAPSARNIIRMTSLTDKQQQLETACEMELTMQSFNGFWHMVGEDDETAEETTLETNLPQASAASRYLKLLQRVAISAS
eukprot:CAMPEP_0194274106 /NCGR_PEP_ID=MMETSP0169-20130528/7276_1 /TAXON_ID=218684 /ORGANISM="Corethron pennatum, Strain L29A3" /LENGTH=83 /DNA_ID=CAMNT_0039017219 /DNA_START=288 /DNA_END=539 /DNA_ORIENTATION=+